MDLSVSSVSFVSLFSLFHKMSSTPRYSSDSLGCARSLHQAKISPMHHGELTKLRAGSRHSVHPYQNREIESWVQETKIEGKQKTVKTSKFRGKT